MKNLVRLNSAGNLVFCTILLALLACSPIHATVLLGYDASSGTPDPTAQGWTKGQGTSLAISASAGSVNGTPVWNITDTVNGDGLTHSLSYTRAITAQQDADLAASGWSLSASLAVGPEFQTSNSANTNLTITSRHLADGTLLTGTNARYYTAFFGSLDGKLQIRLGNYTNTGILWTADSTDLVDVEFRLTPGSGGVSLYANGNLVVDDYVGYAASASTLTVRWGDENNAALNRTQSWATVELQAIPEPSAIALLLPTIAAIAFQIRRRSSAV